MEQTRLLAAGCQDPFFANSSCLTAFIQASLSYLYLVGPRKVCKLKGGFHSRQSPFQGASFFFLLVNFISAIQTANNTTIYF